MHFMPFAPLSDEPLAFHAAPHLHSPRDPLRAHDRRASQVVSLCSGRGC
jgi:hypothetical protein